MATLSERIMGTDVDVPLLSITPPTLQKQVRCVCALFRDSVRDHSLPGLRHIQEHVPPGWRSSIVEVVTHHVLEMSGAPRRRAA